MTYNHAAQTIHAAMSGLLPPIKAKGYAEPYVKLDYDVGRNWKFWLSLSTHADTTAIACRVEHLWGTDLDDILSRAEHWIAELPVDGMAAGTAAMAPWFEGAAA